MKLVLARHTETEWNRERKTQGRKNPPLNKKGREDAALLAEKLRGHGIQFIVSSDLLRAMQTAGIISRILGVSFSLSSQLRECCFGKIEGHTRQEAAELFGSDVSQDLNDPTFQKYDFRRFGGESCNEVFTRHLDALERIMKAGLGEPLLIVGHGRGLCTLLAGFGLPPLPQQGEFTTITLSETELRTASLRIAATS
ncbi:MAG: histidine phosphatase family protein [Parcubacteria group bacterium]|nr:histidine phosphatase family protein [Parcubacteria group bacterium]